MVAMLCAVTGAMRVPITATPVPWGGSADLRSTALANGVCCLEPGEYKEMPLRFIVDPELPEDVQEVALSYTFFRMDGGKKNRTDDGLEKISLAPDAAGAAVQVN